MNTNENPGTLAGAPGLGKPIQAAAEGTRSIARIARAKKAGTSYCVAPSTGEPFRIVVSGRVRWALDRLRAAGPDGCTPIDNPAPRWAAYVHRLRGMGVQIETVTEPHSGGFPGHHARDVLRSGAVRWAKGGAA